MKASVALALSALTVILFAVAPAAAYDQRGHTVTISTGTLAPGVVRLALHERVTFLNLSGRGVHVEFAGPAGEHHVFQVPGQIWAEFHWPGPHSYVVHFSGGQPAELEGVIEVDYGPRLVPGPDCGGFTVDETCIER